MFLIVLFKRLLFFKGKGNAVFFWKRWNIIFKQNRRLSFLFIKQIKTGLISNSVRGIKKVQTLSLKKSLSTARSESRKFEGNFLGRFFVAGPLQKSLQFLREVKVELNKVTWPTRKQTIGSTLVVIILVMIISFFLFYYHL